MSPYYPTNTSWVLGPGGEQVTEYAVSGGTSTWAHTNVFAGGKLLATYNGADTYFNLTDWLGSKRVEIDATGGCAATFASLPFGNTPNSGSSYLPGALPGYSNVCGDATEHHFTGKERDTESGNDYFDARYYSSAMGRFMSPDWSAKEDPVPYAQLDDPQSLNLYAYVRNNPLVHVDADGHCCEADFNSFQTPEQANYFHQPADDMDRQFYGALGSFIKTAATLVAPELGVISAIHDAANGNYGSAGLDLAGAIPVGGLAKGAGILENAAKGAAGEVKSASEIVQEGKTILGSHVGIQTDKGLRVADHLVQDGSKIINDEAKTGGAVRNASQVAKDQSMAANGGKIVGKNAPPELRGQTVKIETNVRQQP